MPIFKDELLNQESLPDLNKPKEELQSVKYNPIPVVPIPSFTGTQVEMPMTLDRLSKIRGEKLAGFENPFSYVSAETLEQNKRYDYYHPETDLENLYGLQQSAWSKWGNSLVKFGATAGGMFVQSFTAVPNVIDAVKKRDFSQLSGDVTGFEGSIDKWLDNLENIFPNYYTRKEQDNPWLAAIPFAPGSANFWGDKFLKNLGFTVGTIAGALVQDAIVTGLTGGSATAPLIAAQVAKISTRLSKAASIFTKAQTASAVARSVGAGAKTYSAIKGLETASQLSKIGSGAQFVTTMAGASMVEAGVEAREGYRHIKETLIKEYTQQNGGISPTGSDLAKIEKYAEDSMNVRFSINTALLMASNSLLFGNLVKNIGRTGKTLKGGNFVPSKGGLSTLKPIGLKEGSIDTFEKQAAKTISNKAWNVIKKYGPTMISEGVYEEGLQFATEKGTYDYFTRKYKNLNNPNNREAWDDTAEAVKSMFYGLGEQFTTDEGLQNMFIGALTGMFVTKVQSIADKKRKTDEDSRTDNAINVLNEHNLSNIFKEKYSDVAESSAILKEMKEANEAKDAFKFKNLQHRFFFNFVNSRSRMDAHEVTVEQLELLKDLDKEQFEAYFGIELNEENKSTVGEYVDMLIEDANKMNKVISNINKTYRNPFNFYKDAKTVEEAEETDAHLIFESWKKEVAYSNSRMEHLDSVKEEANMAISEIAPALSGDTVFNLLTPSGLNSIAEELEQDANSLESTIELTTSARERAKLRKQIKAYRTLAGKASLLANNRSLTPEQNYEYLDALINFENAGRDVTSDSYLSRENLDEIKQNGLLVREANYNKQQIKEHLLALTSESGFKKYLESEIDIQEQVAPEKPGEVNYINEEKETVPLEEGREYEIDKTKKKRYKKINNNRWEVPQPDGSKIYTKTEAQAKIEIENTNNTLSDMNKVKVVGIMPNGVVKIEDAAGNLYDIDASRLKGYKIIKTTQEYIEEHKEEIEEAENETASAAPTIVTLHTSEIFKAQGGRRKDEGLLFTSTTTESEDRPDKETSPHIVRARVFLNNYRKFKEAKNLRAILITPKHADQLGLTGIVEQSYKNNVPDDYLSKESGWMASVFIIRKNNKSYFVDEKGDIINEVGQPTDLNRVVYQTMPTAHLNYNKGKGDPRYRENQLEEAKIRREQWELFREDYFKDDVEPVIFPFSVSKGIGIINEKDKYERNPITHLVPESEISTNNNLITISTTGTFSYQGLANLAVPKGVPILTYKDVAEFLQNRKFTKQEAGAIYEALNITRKNIVTSLNKGEKVSMRNPYWDFVQQVVYTRSKGKAGKNQIRVSISREEIQIGGDTFSFTEFENKREQIISALENTYMSVNNITLTKKFNDEFTEYYLNEKDELIPKTWENYQTYLLSPKDADGTTKRNNIPLTTNIAVPGKGVQYTHKQKYAILHDVNLPVVEHKAPPESPNVKDKKVRLNDKVYNLNGQTINTFQFGTGEVDFIASITSEGTIDVTIVEEENTLETYGKINSNTELLNAIYDAHEKLFGKVPTVEEKETKGNDVILKVHEAIIKNQLTSVLGTLSKKPTVKKKVEGTPTEQEVFILDGVTKNKFKTKTGEEYTFTATKTNKGTAIISTVLDDATMSTIKELNDNEQIQGLKSKLVEINYIDSSADADMVSMSAMENVIIKSVVQKQITNENIPKETPSAEKPITTRKGNRRRLRRKSPLDSKQRMTEEDLEIFKQWHAENVPNIPFEVLERVIKINDTEEAWGEFDLGVVKFAKGALKGTEYHEVFEAIWAGMLSQEERIAILKEFREEKGSFVDRASGKTYMKSDVEVTDEMIRERIADDFSDFRVGKVQAKSLSQKIVDFFLRILNWFKSFNNKPNLRKELFESIDSGKFKDKQLDPYLASGLNKDIYTVVTSKLSEFEGTIIEYVDHIGYRKNGREIAARNIGKGKKILVVLSAMREKYDNKAWTNPPNVDPLPEDAFRSFEEFMLFMYLHEKAHEYILREEGESLKSYETRVNNEAFRRLDEEFRENPKYREIEGMSETIANEYVQDMTLLAAEEIFLEDDKSTLFNYQAITKDDLLKTIYKHYHTEHFSDITWQQLIQRTVDKLRVLNISFNEDNEININEETNNNREYIKDPFIVESKSSSPQALKFLLSTLYEVEQDKSPNILETPEPKLSSIQGYKMLNYSRVFGTLVNTLSNTNDVGKFVEKLINLADRDNNYISLFKKLGGHFERHNNKVLAYMDWDKFDDYDWRLFIQFYQTFSKQYPEAYVQFKDGDETYSIPINTLSTARDVRSAWFDKIKLAANNPKSLVFYDKVEKIYKVKPLKSEIKEVGKYWVVDDLDGNRQVFKTKEEAQTFIKTHNISVNTNAKAIDFLNKLGIEFTMDDFKKLSKAEKEKFHNAVGAMHEYLVKHNELFTISNRTLTSNKPFLDLAELFISVRGMSNDSTHFGVDGKRRGNYALDNAPSMLENDFNETNSIDELKILRPELYDVYSTNSLILSNNTKYADKDGKWRKRIKVSYIQGTKNRDVNKDTTTVNLALNDRHVQEINQNLNGNYYVIIPADSATEWMINMGNNFSFTEISYSTYLNRIYPTFKGYLIDEINLARDYKNREYLKNVKERAQQLRMFREILPEKMMSEIESMIKNEFPLEAIKTYLNEQESKIKESIGDLFSRETDSIKQHLLDTGKIVRKSDGTFSFKELDSEFASSNKLNKDKLSEKELNDILNFVNINQVVSIIEMHKVLFGDPYLFADKNNVSDAVKRIKSFLSPAKKTFDFAPYNAYLNRKNNTVGENINLTNTDFGYHKHKDHLNTVVISDVMLAGSMSNYLNSYSRTDGTDGFSWISDTAYKEVLSKNGQWGDEAEAFFQWQMAYTRQNIPGYTYTDKALFEYDVKLLKSEAPAYYLKVLKPIVRGAKSDRNHIDLALDKFAQMPVFYSMVEGTNMEKLYIKMFNENIDYALVESARKVGIENSHDLYNTDGTFNDSAFNNITKVPWKIYGIQVETSTDGKKYQTRGSQITKMASINLFSNGEPVVNLPEGPEADKRKAYIKSLYNENLNLLDEMHAHAYESMLRRLGIVELDEGGFSLENGKRVSDALVFEMLRRDVNENTKDTVRLDKNNQFKIPFEASPSYVQIKDIMYSMINKTLLSPKMSGGSYVQVPVALFEKATKGRALAMKTKDGWIKISKKRYKELSEEEKKSVMLTDDTLKFYENKDGKRYCEIYVPHWFRDQFKGVFETDEELLKYLNSSEEGRKALTGIGFRIPSQALSSIEVFKVKGFLPQYMGSTVVVPAEITTKTGGDFDIDKLNMYLKSMYLDENDEPQLIKVIDNDVDSKEFYGNLFDTILSKKQKSLRKIIKTIQNRKDNLIENVTKNFKVDAATINNMLETIYGETEESLVGVYDSLAKLDDTTLQERLREDYVDNMYKKALENAYYESLEKLLTLEENFDSLISPISDGGYKATAEKIKKLEGKKETKNKLISRTFLTHKRHSFALAKKWIGIAATNITGLSNRQKTIVYFDRTKINNLDDYYKKWIGDGEIQLPHNTVIVDGVEYLTISSTTTKEAQKDSSLNYLSNRYSGFATATVDVATDDYILDVYFSDQIISAAMFVEAMGAGETGRMFLAQPIIKRYLSKLDNQGLTNIFNEKNIEDILDEYPVSVSFDNTDNTIDMSKLEENIAKYSEATDLSTADMIEYNEQQHHILGEFLKYAKLGKDMFMLNQATNYDTSKIRNGEEYIRKEVMAVLAEENNLFSSAKKVMESTFLSFQKDLVDRSINMLSTIFKLDQPQFKSITNKVLKKYVERSYISKDDLTKIIQDIKLGYLDYLIQSNYNITEEVQKLLMSENNSIALRLEKAREKYDNLGILKELEIELSNRRDGAQTIRLKRRDGDVYDENQYIGQMRELRSFNTETNTLYNDIITLAILQGSKKSSSSIKHIIPIEDYANKVSDIINNVTPSEASDLFSKGMFERNEFNNPVVSTVFIPRYENVKEPTDAQLSKGMTKEEYETRYFNAEQEEIFRYKTKAFKHIKQLGTQNRLDKRILEVNSRFNYKEVEYDLLKIPRTIKVANEYRGDEEEYIDLLKDESIPYLEYMLKKEQGDLSLYNYIGYQKVKLPDGSPLIVQDINGNDVYIYKQVNLLGDGRLLKEYPSRLRPSLVDNGTVKVEQGELNDSDIVSYYDGVAAEKTVKQKEEYSLLAMEDDNIQKVLAGEKTITNRKYYYDSGTYRLFDGSFVSLKNLGKATAVKYLGGKVVQFTETGKKMNGDEFARKEGFKDWKEFEKTSFRSRNFIFNGQYRFIYEITPLNLSKEEQLKAEEAYRKTKEDVQLNLFNKDQEKPNFKSLPEKSATPTMTYAGIGSRTTPKEVLKEMRKVASELSIKGYTLRSGRAKGADTAFESGASKAEIFTANEATDFTRAVAKEIHPNPSKLTGIALDLMARNTNQVFGKDLNTPVDFVLAWTPLTKEGKVVTKAEDRVYYGKDHANNTGGTGQAIAMANLKGIPVINMADANWKKQLEDVLNNKQSIEEQLGEKPEEVEYELSDEQKKQVPQGYNIYIGEDGAYDVTHYLDGVIGEYIGTFEEALNVAKTYTPETIEEEDFLEAVDRVQKEIDAKLDAQREESLMEIYREKIHPYGTLEDYLEFANTRPLSHKFGTNKDKTMFSKWLDKNKAPKKSTKTTFTYHGKTIETEFQLSVEQKPAKVQLSSETASPNVYKIDSTLITMHPDGRMTLEDGREVTNEVLKNKVRIAKEREEGTLRLSTLNNSNYFVLSINNRDVVIGADKNNLGKIRYEEDFIIKQAVIEKAVLYKKEC